LGLFCENLPSFCASRNQHQQVIIVAILKYLATFPTRHGGDANAGQFSELFLREFKSTAELPDFIRCEEPGRSTDCIMAHASGLRARHLKVAIRALADWDPVRVDPNGFIS
jgi:hypothetical protein